MAITLIVNPGSSSKKYALYAGDNLLLAAHIEHDLTGVTMCLSINGVADRCEPVNTAAFPTSLLDFLERAINEKVLTSSTDIAAVGVRVVAPGTYFAAHRVVDDEYILRLQKKTETAPLHIPHTLKELTIIRRALPHAVVVAASDSAFHSSLPTFAHRYSIPESDAAALDLYRFGYHGLSVASVVRRVASVGITASARMVVCHIGSGVSITAVREGKSIDTTMGYAPGSGLIMGSRAGDLDTGALLALMRARNLKPTDAETYLQTAGGLRGLGGENDLRLLLERRAQGQKAATLALDCFVYQLQKAIGSFVAALGGIDALVLTATASERSPALRALILKRLGGLGIVLDDTRNTALVSKEGIISPEGAAVTIAVIKINEAEEIKRVTEMLSV